MLKNIFKKASPNVYLGTLAVVPRTGIKKNFDSWGAGGYIELEGKLKESLQEIFSLPSSMGVSEPLENDLVLDVLIPEFQLGANFFPDTPVPIFWRPKITLVSRLSYMKSGKTRQVISVTEKMPWREFFGRMLSLRGLMQLSPTFDGKDLETLLYLASSKTMFRLKKKL